MREVVPNCEDKLQYQSITIKFRYDATRDPVVEFMEQIQIDNFKQITDVSFATDGSTLVFCDKIRIYASYEKHLRDEVREMGPYVPTLSEFKIIQTPWDMVTTYNTIHITHCGDTRPIAISPFSLAG